MDKKPIWLLDVDGVINAITRNPSKIYTQVAAASGRRSFPIAYRPAVVEFIKAVVEDGIADVIWLTTWGKSANDDLREKLGLPVLEVAGELPSDHGPNWWKLDIVKAHPEWDDRPIVWTDDDLVYSRGAVDWVAEQLGRVLAIAPRPQLALSDNALDQIADFLLEHQPADAV